MPPQYKKDRNGAQNIELLNTHYESDSELSLQSRQWLEVEDQKEKNDTVAPPLPQCATRLNRL
jgi:hypothetical protein